MSDNTVLTVMCLVKWDIYPKESGFQLGFDPAENRNRKDAFPI